MSGRKKSTKIEAATGQRSNAVGKNPWPPASQLPVAVKWIAFALVVLLYVLLRLSSIGIPLDRDEGVFGYAGQRIIEGGQPYRDVVDHKPPGVFYIYALALSFVPPTPNGIHSFLQFYNFLTLLALGLLMRTLFNSDWALISGAFCYALFSASPAIQGFTASTEMFMLLPVVLSVLFAVLGEKKSSPALFLLSGAAAAASFWIKQTALASAGFSVVYIVCSGGLQTADATALGTEQKGRPYGQAARRLALWIAGAAVISGTLCAYFYYQGTFSEFIYWSFTHNIAYSAQLSPEQIFDSWRTTFGQVLKGDFAIIGLGVIVAAWNFKRRRSESVFVLCFLIFSMIGTVPGFAYAHYFAQLAPAVAIAAGWGLTVLAESSRSLYRWVGFGAATALLLIPVSVHRGFFLERDPDVISSNFFGENPFPESAELSRFLASRTTPEDRIFIFGSEPQILLQAGRLSASPFVMIYPLMRENPRVREFQERVWEDIKRSHPAYVVFANLPTSALWDGKTELKILANLQELLRTDYRMEAVMPIVSPKGTLTVVTKDTSPEVLRAPLSIYVYKSREPGA